MAELIKFIHEDAEVIRAEMKAYMEKELNRQIAPADIEQLLINTYAYRELLIRAGLNHGARQNLVAFSAGAALEELGRLVGVSRLPASGALCTIQLSLIAGHTGVVIPEGIRIGSTDGKAIFQTIESVVVPPGVQVSHVGVACSEMGIVGNGYAPNTITIILDPQPYLTAAWNVDQSAGGANEETDNDLRDRIKLAPASFSVAGPKDAYEFFAKSASSAIVDVKAISPIPGQVNIYPLLENGEMPTSGILDAVLAICSGDKIRPLTDTVVVVAPTVIEYSINVGLTLLVTAVNTDADARVQAVLSEWTKGRENKLGLDVVINKIRSLSMIEGVYDVDVISPSASIIASPNVYSKCNGITVTITGTHDE